jgi:hypothetical protein
VTVQQQMPQYQCHKKVWALQITAIHRKPNPDVTSRSGAASYGAILHVEEPYAPIEVSAVYMNRHNPAVTGYYLVYKDGYKSYSPKAPFEDGYARV